MPDTTCPATRTMSAMYSNQASQEGAWSGQQHIRISVHRTGNHVDERRMRISGEINLVESDQERNFLGWPLLTVNNAMKYYPKTVETPKGHMNLCRRDVTEEIQQRL